MAPKAAAKPSPAPAPAKPAAAAPAPAGADDGKDAASARPNKWAHLPAVKLALRAKEGVQLLTGPFNGAYQKPDAFLHPDTLVDTVFSPDGALWAVATAKGVFVYDTARGTAAPKFVVESRKAVSLLAFSPAATYLVLYEEKSSDDAPQNLTVYSTGHTAKGAPAGAAAAAGGDGDDDADDSKAAPAAADGAADAGAKGCAAAAGTLVAAFAQGKFVAKAAWPVLRWDDRETVCGRLVANGVELLDGDLTAKADDAKAAGAAAAGGDAGAAGKKRVLGKITAEGIQHFTIAPKAVPIAIATFVPSKKDTPAKVGVWEYPAALANPKASKSLFTEEAELRWHPQGTALLLLASSELDKSGKSYYGESGLFVLTTDGKTSVAVDKSGGTVCDAAWNPNGKEFVVIQGAQPARARAYNVQGVPHFEFGTNARNTVRWSPHGRFVMIGGFASLPGDMDFWDRNKKKVIAPAKDFNSPKSFQWFPDSRSFVTATTRPRRVDNGFKVWSYAGELQYSEKHEELWQIAVCPAAHAAVYPDRPQSPRLSDKRLAPARAAAAAAAPKAYVPPHRRGDASGGTGTRGHMAGAGAAASPAPAVDLMKASKAVTGPRSLSSLERQVATTGSASVGGAYVPGAQLVPVQQPANLAATEKNRKRRERKKAAKARAADGDDEGEGEDGGEEDGKAAAEAAAPAPEPAKASALDETQKKVRNLTKKLKQIEELAARQAKGEALDAAAAEKVKSIPKLKAEIAALNAA